MAFFALAAGALVLFRRPFDFVGWASLAACVAFVILACCGLFKRDIGLLKPGIEVGRQKIDDPTTSDRPRTIGIEPVENIPIGDPSPNELRLLETTIAALEGGRRPPPRRDRCKLALEGGPAARSRPAHRHL
ncbi:hypothetical protein [Methylorubrum sp. SB2]|uniref:hypothetical protein n=1 Tax=Methylorubrum subtropicum TaxID=3138812 RepID=UPI00313C39B9